MPSLNLVRSISGTVKTFSLRASGARVWGGWSPHSGHSAHRKPLVFLGVEVEGCGHTGKLAGAGTVGGGEEGVGVEEGP